MPTPPPRAHAQWKEGAKPQGAPGNSKSLKYELFICLPPLPHHALKMSPQGRHKVQKMKVYLFLQNIPDL